MRFPRRPALIFTLSALTVCAADNSRGDTLKVREEIPAALLAAENENPGDVETLCRISDAYGLSIATVSGSREKKAMGDKSLEYARLAVEKAQDNGKAHRTLAIAYGRVAQLLDHRTRIRYATLIRDHAQKALALNPDDALTCHLLGVWNYEMARISPMMRMMATTLYGPLPKGSNQEAIKYLERAVRLDPENLESRFALGQAYLAGGESKKARAAFEEVLKLPDKEGKHTELRETAKRQLR